MKRTLTLSALFLSILTGAYSTLAQGKEESLSWLRAHLQTMVTRSDDNRLPFTMTKTYTFYNDAFVVKTVRDFEDKDLNGHPAFSKIWYADIIREQDTTFEGALQMQQPDSIYLYTIMAEHVYFIIGKEDTPISFWRTFDEPSGLDLYLLKDKALSIEVIKHFMILSKTDEDKNKSDLQAQSVESDALQWLQQHQDALAYRIQISEEKGYLQKNLRFLPDKIVERAEHYDNDGRLLSADEQDWFYREFRVVDNIQDLVADTVNHGKLCLIRLITLLTLIGETEEIQGNALFEFGFTPGDIAAKQKVLQAVKAVMLLAGR